MPTFNLKTNYGAKGDGQDVTTNVTISSGSSILAVSAAIFSSVDVGKAIGVGGAGSSAGGILQTTIASFTDSQHITLNAQSATTLSAASQRIVWGTDDSSAWRAFALANAGASNVTLTVPSGIYIVGSIFGLGLAEGLAQVVVNGAGSSLTKLTNYPLINSGYTLGSQLAIADPADPTKTANIATASAGSTFVTLILSSQSSNFSPNSWGLITGFDLQGQWNPGGSGFGFPPNPFYFEYVLMTAISSITGVVTLSAPLRETYKATWPLFDTGGINGAYEGGPATLYWLSSNWNIDIQWNNMSMERANSDGTVGQINTNARKITFSGCVFPFGYPLMSQCYQFIGVNSDWSANPSVEVDKIIDTIMLTNCTFNGIQYQSADYQVIMNGCTVASHIGTPRYFYAYNMTFPDLRIGPDAYGRTDRVVLGNCSVASIIDNAPILDGSSGAGVNNSWTADGVTVLTIPNSQSVGASQNQLRGLMPNTYFMWRAQYENERMSQTGDATQDSSNCYVRLNTTGGFPSVPLSSAGKLDIHVHPCPDMIFSNCTGSDMALEMSAIGRAPMFSYTSRTYSSNIANGSAASALTMWGALKSIKINVTKAYTGAGGSLSFHVTQFDNWNYLDASNAVQNYGPIVNAKISGLRSWTSSGGWIGSQSGDTLPSFPTGGWIAGVQGAGAALNTSISSESSGVFPSVSVEIITDQGIPTTYVVPRSLNVHS